MVAARDGTMRLDRFLDRCLPRWSRRRSRWAIETHLVRVNGRTARKGQLVRPGDIVHIEIDRALAELEPEPELPLAVVHDDPAMLAIDKPAGMPTVALRPSDRGTVANALLARYPEIAHAGGPLEAGLVHRLDTPTSGILVAARTRADWRLLRAQFHARQVAKLYLATVHGVIARPGVITTAIGHESSRQSRRMQTFPYPQRHPRGRPRAAFTRYRPVARWQHATLLAVAIRTGVRHQVRVHLASIGYPILGDTLYAVPARLDAPSRLMLHAARIAFAHPRTRTRIVLRSPLPRDYWEVLNRLERRKC